MKAIFIIILPLFLLMQQEIYAQGIQFEKSSWETILQKASDEGKIIFVDAYAVWCGPCKMMDKNVFSDANVGDYYNKHFINAKIDMEKGEGVDLAQKYEVRAYPTFLFVDGKGELVHRAVGYHASDQFLNLGSVARDDDKNMGSMERRYRDGDRTPDFLYDYAMTKADAYDPDYMDVVNEYMATQGDWATDKNREFIFRFAEEIDTPFFNYILKNRAAFEKQFGADEVVSRVMGSVSELLYQEEYEGEGIEQASKIFKQFDSANAARMDLEFRMYYYLVRQMTDEYAETTIQLYAAYPPNDWQTLNETAWAFYETVDNKAQLQAALGWAERSVSMDRNYYNMDTLAALHYKLGSKKKAMKFAKEAMKIGEKAGEDVSGTKELIKLIKS
jgi:thioredoxin-related protein